MKNIQLGLAILILFSLVVCCGEDFDWSETGGGPGGSDSDSDGDSDGGTDGDSDSDTDSDSDSDGDTDAFLGSCLETSYEEYNFEFCSEYYSTELQDEYIAQYESDCGAAYAGTWSTESCATGDVTGICTVGKVDYLWSVIYYYALSLDQEETYQEACENAGGIWE